MKRQLKLFSVVFYTGVLLCACTNGNGDTHEAAMKRQGLKEKSNLNAFSPIKKRTLKKTLNTMHRNGIKAPLIHITLTNVFVLGEIAILDSCVSFFPTREILITTEFSVSSISKTRPNSYIENSPTNALYFPELRILLSTNKAIESEKDCFILAKSMAYHTPQADTKDLLWISPDAKNFVSRFSFIQIRTKTVSDKILNKVFVGKNTFHSRSTSALGSKKEMVAFSPNNTAYFSSYRNQKKDLAEHSILGPLMALNARAIWDKTHFTKAANTLPKMHHGRPNNK